MLEKHPTRSRPAGQFAERAAIHRLVGDIDVDPLGLHIEEFGILDLQGHRPHPFDQLVTLAANCDDIAGRQLCVHRRFDDPAIAPNALDEGAMALRGVGFQVCNRPADERTVRPNAISADLEVMPFRPRFGGFSCAEFPLVVLACGNKIDSQQLWPELREDQG
ncbi:hypothetical protein D3C86_1343930 [compost metagenome]